MESVNFHNQQVACSPWWISYWKINFQHL